MALGRLVEKCRQGLQQAAATVRSVASPSNSSCSTAVPLTSSANPRREQLPRRQASPLRVCRGFREAIGETPLLKLCGASAETGCNIWGKCEFLNPGGSVKDRPAVYMLQRAERSGKAASTSVSRESKRRKRRQLQQGGWVVEASAGNTAIALTLAAKAKQYRVVCVMPDTQTEEKKDLLMTLGAVVLRVPFQKVAHPNHYTKIAERLASTIGGFYCGQAGVLSGLSAAGKSRKRGAWGHEVHATVASSGFPQANRQAHFETTGQEIWYFMSQLPPSILRKSKVLKQGLLPDSLPLAKHPQSVKVKPECASAKANTVEAILSALTRTAAAASSAFFRQQTGGRIHGFICAAGTGGTLVGTASRLRLNSCLQRGRRAPDKEKLPFLKSPSPYPLACSDAPLPERSLAAEGGSAKQGSIHCTRDIHLPTSKSVTEKRLAHLVASGWPCIGIADIQGAGLFRLYTTGTLHAEGTSIVENEGLPLGMTSGLNVAGAVRLAKALGPGHTIVTVLCDYGHLYKAKQWNPPFLRSLSLPEPSWMQAEVLPEVLTALQSSILPVDEGNSSNV
ncbi:O-acetylserine lyase [Cyclospora cayetanensis]|uniref:O-acetylserine lyase n=1 Tax=Cyclospora cayetanensis TaxID=88456 RepID=A0A1D3DAV2_9EIME|nr:O-acetylserine lyase [Cyclospora cayetanensis]